MMVRPRWVLALLLALGIAAAFALLGQWQLERAIVSGEVVERSTETALPLDKVAKPGGPVNESATGQKVSVAGHFVAGDDQLIRDRVNQGEDGYWVVSHFVTDADSASIPVARGFAADEAAARSAIRSLAASGDAGASSVTVTGRFLPSEAPVVPPEGTDPHAMTAVSVAALINLWPDFTAPVYAGYIVDAGAQHGLDLIYSPAPDDDVALNWLNVFYAAEWAVFAGFAVFLWYRLVRDAVEREEEEEAALADAGSLAASPPSPGT
ncbi:SURF1 family protein [Glaciibacter sp. 2TAF33]|uniref:SURF1 family protein n=1 Tax=Glaciibacter sp. 2TAF33 TaxID=3233015 RepID=UPI003F90EC48